MNDAFHVYHSVNSSDDRPRGIALGIFDGFHLGHQALMVSLIRVCRERGLRVGVFTFSFPEGVAFGGRDIHHTELMSDTERIQVLKAFGVDDVYMIPVSDAIVRLLPDVFLRSVIMERLSGKVLAIGEDARFGYKGEGDAAMLRAFASRNAFQAIVVPDVIYDGAKVSSSRIRALLSSGDVESANRMMTRPFRLICRWSSGDALPSDTACADFLGCPHILGTSEHCDVLTLRYPERSIVLSRGLYRVALHVPSTRQWNASENGDSVRVGNIGSNSAQWQAEGVTEMTFLPDRETGIPSLHLSVRLTSGSPDALHALARSCGEECGAGRSNQVAKQGLPVFLDITDRL